MRLQQKLAPKALIYLFTGSVMFLFVVNFSLLSFIFIPSVILSFSKSC